MEEKEVLALLTHVDLKYLNIVFDSAIMVLIMVAGNGVKPKDSQRPGSKSVLRHRHVRGT